SNFIFDHCNFGWSTEENLNTQDSHYLTVQNSIIHEGLYNSGHKKGARGYGAQLGGSPASFHHNLYIHNTSRSPRINGARGNDNVVFVEHINNVNYNYGKRGGCYGGENTANISTYNGLNSAHECNFMNNYYKPGPTSDKSKVEFVKSSYARSGAKSWAPAKWYIDGNVAVGIANATEDNWKGVAVETYPLDSIKAHNRIYPARNYYIYSPVGQAPTYTPENYMLFGIESAEDAFATVVKRAGTVNPDKVEVRLRDEALNGTTTYGNKGIIDTEDDAEGFYAYTTDYTVPVDTDGDGLPDEWELKYATSISEIDNNTLLPEFGGYTALEYYLNSLMGEGDFVSEIADLTFDNEVAETHYYTLQGIRLTENPSAPGLYITRQGVKTSKIIVR
ncbi:MAG: hypothetical protein NC039_09260, partial [Muribaculaceae bacterium]|nr:hypothetical protein [Muribaculaceae bacterium]